MYPKGMKPEVGDIVIVQLAVDKFSNNFQAEILKKEIRNKPENGIQYSQEDWYLVDTGKYPTGIGVAWGKGEDLTLIERPFKNYIRLANEKT